MRLRDLLLIGLLALAAGALFIVGVVVLMPDDVPPPGLVSSQAHRCSAEGGRCFQPAVSCVGTACALREGAPTVVVTR